MTREELVAHARGSISRGSKSFALASQLFDHATRERAWLLYAWCRACDDITDGQDHGGPPVAAGAPATRLAEMRLQTDAALQGATTGIPAFDGLGVVARETGFPHRFPHDLIEGLALDVTGWRPQTTGDLMRYCYYVAGSVGCMMAIVMGVLPHDEPVLDRACDLGLAFQLTNIARDLREDAESGRCYIPTEWLKDGGFDADRLMAPENRPKLAAIGSGLTNLAARYEGSARHGTGALPFRGAWAVLAATGIYGDIAREIARRGEHAWDSRATTSRAAKLGWIIRSVGQAAVRSARWPQDAPRDPVLWQRPVS